MGCRMRKGKCPSATVVSASGLVAMKGHENSPVMPVKAGEVTSP